MATSSPNNLGTLTGLRDRLASRRGFPSGYSSAGSAIQAQIDNAIEAGLDRLTSDEEWLSDIVPDSVNTLAPLTGTDGAVTAGDATVTSATGGFTSYALRDRIQIGDLEVGATVVSVTDTNSLELQSAYPGATATAQTFTLVRDEYALAAGAWQVLEVWSLDDPTGSLTPIAEADARRRNFDALETGRPEFFSLAPPLGTEDANTVGIRIRLYPAPDAVYTLNYRYRSVAAWPSANFKQSPHMHQVLYRACYSEMLLDLGALDEHERNEKAYQRALAAARERDNARLQTRQIMGTQFGRRGSDQDIVITGTIQDA